MPTRIRRFVCVLLVTAAGGSGVVHCPARADSQQSPAPGVLEEVVVTAQRREESVMVTPVAITALAGEQLDRLGALDLTYLGQVTPNTAIEPARGTNSALAAYIRGVGQQDHIAGFESGVGLYLDDVYLDRPQSALLDVYEVQRIEVLRGPQGTLYGRNTIGGAIRYITRRLDDAANVRLRTRVGNYGMMDGILGVTVPAGDQWRLGATLASFSLDGFGDNLFRAGERNYEKDILAARVAVEWTPRDQWFLRLAADWLDDDSDLRRSHRLLPGRYSHTPVPGNVFDSQAGNQVPVAGAEVRGLSLTVDWMATERLTLRSILSARADETWRPVDLDALPTVDADTATWDRNRQRTAELQALFDGQRWNVVSGVFALDARAQTTLHTILGVIGTNTGRPGLGNQLLADIETHGWAAYADATYELRDAWRATLGARYTHDTRGAAIRRETTVGGFSPFFGGQGTAVALPSDFEGSETFSRVTPRAVLQWQPVDTQSVYLSYSEGFKGGGFDPRGLSSRAPDFDHDGVVSPAEIHAFMKFDPEQVASWEVGWKATVFEGAVQSRLALFSADYTDVQIAGAVGVDIRGNGAPEQYVGKTSNDAAAKLQGMEWEGQALMAHDLVRRGSRLDLTWSLGFIDAQFDAFIDDKGQDVSGQRVFPNTSRWNTALALTYLVPVDWFDASGQFSVTSAFSWRDHQYQSEIPEPLIDQDAFALWDLGLAWSSQDGQWRVALQGRNLADRHYKVSGLSVTLGTEGNLTAWYGPPRQVWLDVQYRYSPRP